MLSQAHATDDDMFTVPVAFNFMLGRVYAHTMLYGLNLRRSAREGSSSDGLHTSGDMNATNPAISLSGIRTSASRSVYAIAA
jgi:hypothetical protein